MVLVVQYERPRDEWTVQDMKTTGISAYVSGGSGTIAKHGTRGGAETLARAKAEKGERIELIDTKGNKQIIRQGDKGEDSNPYF